MARRLQPPVRFCFVFGFNIPCMASLISDLLTPPATTTRKPALLKFAAHVWLALWPTVCLIMLSMELRFGWTDGIGHPFGEDFINFWSAAYLALHGHILTAYDFAAFHHFHTRLVGYEMNLYHYSYPPVMALVTLPFGLLPYPAAWLVWQVGGWLAFALCLRKVTPGNWLLLSLAWPALYVNTISGQNGCWIAAITGWGLLLLQSHRCFAAGLVFSLLMIKPQLAWLFPIALLSGREWKALTGMIVGAVCLFLATLAAYGPTAWYAWHERVGILRRIILENGGGVMHRMMSVFVFVRHAGGGLTLAYAAQAIASLIAASLVVLIWRKTATTQYAFRWRAATLIFAMLAGSLYVTDYDCIILAMACALIWPVADLEGREALACAAIAPILTSAIAKGTPVALGSFMLWPALFWIARQCFRNRKGVQMESGAATGMLSGAS